MQIFYNIRVVGVPHTMGDERYLVSRIRSFDGIYAAVRPTLTTRAVDERLLANFYQTLRLGYRDRVDLRHISQPIRDRIVALESREGPQTAKIRAEMIESALKNAMIHMWGPPIRFGSSPADGSHAQLAPLPRYGRPDGG